MLHIVEVQQKIIFPLQLKNLNVTIHARIVDQMPNVTMDFVRVYLNIMAIHISVVARNVFLIQTVHAIELVYAANVSIRVLEHVD